MIPVGALVTLLVEKSFPGLDTINSGISGMVVGHTRAADGLLHIVDFGPEGQWNCLEPELRQESMLDRLEREEPVFRLEIPEDDTEDFGNDDDDDDDDDDDEEDEDEDIPSLAEMDRTLLGRDENSPTKEKIQPIRSFEEDLAMMEEAKLRRK